MSVLADEPESMHSGVAGEIQWQPDLTQYRRWFNAYESNKKDELDEQRTHEQYYHDKHWTAEEMAKLRKRGQAPIFDNRIKRKIDFLVGVEQRMRRDPKAYPRGPDDDKKAGVATAAMRYCCDINRWETIGSTGTHFGLVRGIGVVYVGVKNNRTGMDPYMRWVPSDRFFYDPRSMSPDFSDARYMGVHIWMDIDEAIEHWPDREEEMRQFIDKSNTDLKLMRSDQDHAKQWADFERRRMRLVEFWERAMVPQQMSQPDMMGSTAMTQPGKVSGWRYVVFTGSLVLEAEVSPYVDEEGAPDNPYVAWSPYVDERGDRYGPIRSMKPMQDEVNHRRSKFLHLLNSKQLYTRKGDLDDIDQTRAEMAKPDGIIEHNGEWGSSTGVVDRSEDIKGQAELLAQSQSSLENLGPNPGLIGKGGGVADQSGRAILAQRDSGMTELSPVFERNRDWKLRVYRKLWNRIKQAWQAPKFIRITDDDNAPAFLGINQFGQDPMTGQLMSQNVMAEIDVDIIMEEGPDVITMNEELLQTLSQIGANPAVPPKVLIELSNAPNKDRLFKLLDEATAPNPQIAEMQQRMAKLEELLAAAKVDQAVADVENKRADTVTKLRTAFTPQAAPTNEFGQQTGPAPAQPNMMEAVTTMRAFPLNYGMPTLEQMALSMPMPQAEPEGDEQQPMQAGPMPPQGMPPHMMPGGMPIDPALANMGIPQ